MMLFGLQLPSPKPAVRTVNISAGLHPLTSLPVGAEARLAGFAPTISSARRAQLMAYGLTPGTRLKVIQRALVSVIQIDQLELALETALATEVLVQV